MRSRRSSERFDPTAGRAAAEIAARFCDRYGAPALVRLIRDAEAGCPASVTAARLGLSRQRINQIRAAIGVRIRVYYVDSEIQRIAHEDGRGPLFGRSW